MVENIVYTNQKLEKIEVMSISKNNFHQKLTHDKEDEAIINEMTNSIKKDEDYKEVLYTHSFSNDSSDDHSNLYYYDDVNDHIPYDELLDVFKESFVKSKKIACKNSVLKKHVASLMI